MYSVCRVNKFLLSKKSSYHTNTLYYDKKIYNYLDKIQTNKSNDILYNAINRMKADLKKKKKPNKQYILTKYEQLIKNDNIEKLLEKSRLERKPERRIAFHRQALLKFIDLGKIESYHKYLSMLDNPPPIIYNYLIVRLLRKGYGEEAYNLFLNLSVKRISPPKFVYFELVKYLYNTLQTRKGWILFTEMKSKYSIDGHILEFCYDHMLHKTKNIKLDEHNIEYTTSHLIKLLKNSYSNKELMKIEKLIMERYNKPVGEELFRHWISAIIQCRGIKDAFLFTSHFNRRFKPNYFPFSVLAVECEKTGNIEASINALSYADLSLEDIKKNLGISKEKAKKVRKKNYEIEIDQVNFFKLSYS